jgi:hypothetical protein
MSLNNPFVWCRKLRWKSHAWDQGDPQRVADVFRRDEVIYTCLATAQPFGADDGPVAPERCTRERSCFLQHPNSRLPLV